MAPDVDAEVHVGRDGVANLNVLEALCPIQPDALRTADDGIAQKSGDEPQPVAHAAAQFVETGVVEDHVGVDLDEERRLHLRRAGVQGAVEGRDAAYDYDVGRRQRLPPYAGDRPLRVGLTDTQEQPR